LQDHFVLLGANDVGVSEAEHGAVHGAGQASLHRLALLPRTPPVAHLRMNRVLTDMEPLGDDLLRKNRRLVLVGLCGASWTGSQDEADQGKKEIL
jgi:hypothetical protein